MLRSWPGLDDATKYSSRPWSSWAASARDRVDGFAAKPGCPPPLDQRRGSPGGEPSRRTTLPAALVGAKPHELEQLGMSDVIRAKNLPQKGVVLCEG